MHEKEENEFVHRGHFELGIPTSLHDDDNSPRAGEDLRVERDDEKGVSGESRRIGHLFP